MPPPSAVGYECQWRPSALFMPAMGNASAGQSRMTMCAKDRHTKSQDGRVPRIRCRRARPCCAVSNSIFGVGVGGRVNGGLVEGGHGAPSRAELVYSVLSRVVTSRWCC